MTRRTQWLLPLGVVIGAAAALIVPRLFEEEPERAPVNVPCPVTPAEVAAGRQTFPDAAPYAGPGPHPVGRWFADRRPGDGHGAPQRDKDTPLPANWLVADEGRRTMQLVLCEYLDSVGGSVRGCAYQGIGNATGSSGSLAVVPARYTFELVEARTGRVLTTFQLDGRTESCPPLTRGTSGVSPLVPGEIELVNAVRSFVERPVPG
ncbi:hypothetical protein EV193_1011096 [Herbihabitans rhizosphaerae]|uniref:Uncharacterized protein n=1 Tax=Herbihabitans rhizosphaerae TaxID=1872711 RepID=A0A4Q7L693_9PSEU|nr:hypothetical protein [Herbihabitans rhizosphaerae]RZS45209.1 hypothetical protein EV193_1011096 [Herbihabitans rhizosphaerae]